MIHDQPRSPAGARCAFRRAFFIVGVGADEGHPKRESLISAFARIKGLGPGPITHPPSQSLCSELELEDAPLDPPSAPDPARRTCLGLPCSQTNASLTMSSKQKTNPPHIGCV